MSIYTCVHIHIYTLLVCVVLFVVALFCCILFAVGFAHVLLLCFVVYHWDSNGVTVGFGAAAINAAPTKHAIVHRTVILQIPTDRSCQVGQRPPESIL